MNSWVWKKLYHNTHKLVNQDYYQAVVLITINMNFT